MAYLRQILAILTVLAGLAGLTGGTADFDLKAPVEASSLREAGQSASLIKPAKNTRKALETYYSRKLAALGINLRPGTEHRSDSKATQTRSRRCRSLVYQVLMKLPKAHRDQLKELTLFYTKDGRRGLSGNGAMVLRCINVSDAELVSVLTHEIGHLVDATHLVGFDEMRFSGFYDFGTPVLDDDASALFYKIAWDSETEMKDFAGEVDFVSLYAMTDPFEDFAETYTYFRLHGAEFRKLIQTSGLLKKKYNFMKWYVFGGREFGENSGGAGDREDIDIWERNYDVTVLPFSLKAFLAA